MLYTRGEVSTKKHHYIVTDSVTREVFFMTLENIKDEMDSENYVVGSKLVDDCVKFIKLNSEVSKLLYASKGVLIGVYFPEYRSWITTVFIDFSKGSFNFTLGGGDFSISVEQIVKLGYLFDYNKVDIVTGVDLIQS